DWIAYDLNVVVDKTVLNVGDSHINIQVINAPNGAQSASMSEIMTDEMPQTGCSYQNGTLLNCSPNDSILVTTYFATDANGNGSLQTDPSTLGMAVTNPGSPRILVRAGNHGQLITLTVGTPPPPPPPPPGVTVTPNAGLGSGPQHFIYTFT